MRDWSTLSLDWGVLLIHSNLSHVEEGLWILSFLTPLPRGWGMQHAQEGPIYTSLIFHASLVTEEFSGLGRFPQATTDVFFYASSS